jgi:hypothetical protein
VIGRVRELPGAVFFGDALDQTPSANAVRLQRIRREYENEECQASLWHDLSQMGFEPADIRRFAVNPASITSCAYGTPTRHDC